MLLGMRCILERLLGQDLSDFDNTRFKEELFSMLTECLVHLQPSTMLIEMAAVSRFLTGSSWMLNWSRPKIWALKIGSAITCLYVSGKAPKIRVDHVQGFVIIYGISIRTIADVQAFQPTRTTHDSGDYQHHLHKINALSRVVRASRQHAKSRQTDRQNSSRDTTAVLTQELSELFEEVRVANQDAASELRLYLVLYLEILLSDHLQPETMFTAFTTQYRRYNHCAPNDISVSCRDSEAIFLVHTAICAFLCYQKAATFECVFRASDPNNYIGADIPKINFGILMTGVEVGDQVVLVEGSTMSFIMRAAQNNFRLVSPSFVVGLMNGEAWNARVMRYLAISAERIIEVDYQEYAKLDQICIC